MKIYNTLVQGTPEWLEARMGVITGTKLKGVAGGPKAQLTEMYSLLAEKYVEEEDLKPFEIIERGHELEPIAKAKYEKLTGQTVEEVGFVKKEDWLGLSPDGLISTNGIYNKAIEIKCPRGKNFMKYVLEDKIPDEYRWQIANYFIVIDDLEELDFIVYNPDVSTEINNLHIINVKRADLQKDIDTASDKLKDFKTNWDNLDKQLKNDG